MRRPPQDLVVTDTIRPEEQTGELIRASDLLAEPPSRSPEWMPGIVRRMTASWARPIAQSVAGPYAERLEAAGWFVAGADADLEAARLACWPVAAVERRLALGFGSLAPKLVIVGERAQAGTDLPFASRGGTWLFAGLCEALGWDELSIYATNSQSASGRRLDKQLAELHAAFAKYDPVWLALGKQAKQTLRQAGIEHVGCQHPAWHMRYKASEGVEGYVELLRAGGMTEGPGIPKGSTNHVDKLPEMPAPYEVRSVAYIKGKSTPAKGNRSRGGVSQVDPVKREKARQDYVTGVATSLADAARRASVNIDSLYNIARDEGWREERDAYQRQVTEEVKEAAKKAEAKASGNARKLAWAATERALGSVVQRLKTGELTPTPRDAKALADCALTLTDRVVDPGEKQDDLGGKTIKELVAEVQRSAQEGLGGQGG